MKTRLSEVRAILYRTLLLVGLLMLLLPGHPVVSSPVETVRPSEGLDLRWTSPPLRLGAASAAPAALSPRFSGWQTLQEPGRPALPYTTTLVVLPPTGGVTLTVRVLEETARTLRSPLALEPPPEIPSLWPLEPGPPAGVTFTELGVLSGVRLGRLTFVPLDYDPATRQLTQIHAVEVTLHFEEPLPPASGSVGPLQGALRPLVANPEQLPGYPAERQPDTLFSGAGDAADLRLGERGLYALPWSALQTAGVVTETSDPARVQLHRPATGEELALQWDAAGERFLLYADPEPTRWADHEVYRFGYGATPGLRMGERAPLPSQPAGVPWVTVQREEQRSYDSRRPSPRDGDPWYWSCLERPAGPACPASSTYTLTLETPLTSAEPATLTLWLQGYTSAAPNPDHRVGVALNDVALGEISWEGAGAFTATLSVPAQSLRSGANVLELALPGLTDVPNEGLWLDAFALRYPLGGVTADTILFTGEGEPRTYTLSGLPEEALVYEVTDPAAPVRLTPGPAVTDGGPGPRSYLALHPEAIRTAPALEPVATLAPPAGADYLVIAPSELVPALAPLLALHEGRGLATFVAPAEAIYDHYGDGRMAPVALRAFVAEAYATWEPRPAYLLLVGDGTWDPLDHLGTGTPTLLPPYMAYVDPWLGEVPADNRYVTVDGDDALPDLAVGRLPVNDEAELETVVAKLVDYATAPFPGDWNRRHLFVADDPDPAGNFPAEAEKITVHVPLTHTTTRLYCTDAPDAPYECANLTEVRSRLLSAWDRGALLINWVGHGAFQQWEHGRLFHTDDLVSLARGPHYPLLLSMSCYTSHFAHPDPLQTALDEALVREADAGAIGTFGSSGLGLGSDHTLLHLAFYRTALGGDRLSPGLAAGVAKAAVAGGSGDYLLESYHFFGDPALPLAWDVPPWAARVYLPLTLGR